MSLSRFVQVSYVFGLSLALTLLLLPSSSRGQFRATPAIPGLTFLEGINPYGPYLRAFIPNDGRFIGLPGPPLNLMLNNFLTDTTGSPLALIGMQGCMGIGGIGGGILGIPLIPSGAGGFLGAGGGISGFAGGIGGGTGGVGGVGGAGGMGGFAGKGMGGFNGKKAL